MIRLLVVALWLIARSLAAQQLEIHFLNVGQADAAIIQEAGRTAVIDAGTTTGIGAYLQSLHIDTIDLVVASHPHADHIGGMILRRRDTAAARYCGGEILRRRDLRRRGTTAAKGRRRFTTPPLHHAEDFP